CRRQHLWLPGCQAANARDDRLGPVVSAVAGLAAQDQSRNNRGDRVSRKVTTVEGASQPVLLLPRHECDQEFWRRTVGALEPEDARPADRQPGTSRQLEGGRRRLGPATRPAWLHFAGGADA